jgi:hypothetical protein
MTFSSAVLALLRRYYRRSLYQGGTKKFYRDHPGHRPTACVEDAPVRLHMITRGSLQWVARQRVTLCKRLRLDLEKMLEFMRLPPDFVNGGGDEVLWMDAFLAFILPVETFFETEPESQIYVLVFDHGTIPAKYLAHKKRYKTSPSAVATVEDPNRVSTVEDLLKLFNEPRIPIEKWDALMRQKKFVDALARMLVKTFITVFYRPPSGRHLVVDGPKPGAPTVLVTHKKSIELKDPMFKPRCPEGDVKVVAWVHTLTPKHTVKVMSRDGDVFLALLMHTRYRATRLPNGNDNDEQKVVFEFSNVVWVEKDFQKFDEDTTKDVDDQYLMECAETHPNEYLIENLSSGTQANDAEKEKARVQSRNKDQFLYALQRRYEQQKQRDRELWTEIPPPLLTNNPDAGSGGDAKSVVGRKRKAPSSTLIEKLFAPDANTNSVNGDDTPTAKGARDRCDIFYECDGTQRFETKEIILINDLFQEVYDHSLQKYDARISTTVEASAFLPIENFACVCMLCGSDYVDKPRGIGEEYLVRAYFEQLNTLTNLVSGNFVKSSSSSSSALTKSTTDRTISPVDQYLQLLINPDSLLVLLQRAFAMKGMRVTETVRAEFPSLVANLRFALSYFHNDHKLHVAPTDCFAVHRPNGCNRSMYGYVLIDKKLPPSIENVDRTTDVCDCYVAKLRAEALKNVEQKVRLF